MRLQRNVLSVQQIGQKGATTPKDIFANEPTCLPAELNYSGKSEMAAQFAY